MAEFLDLRGQGAAAGAAAFAVDDAHALFERGARETPPVDGRIAPRAGREQVAVFDVQQRADQHRGNFLERRVLPFGKAALLQRGAVAVEQRQSGLALLAVDRVEAALDRFEKFFRRMRLRGGRRKLVV